MKKLIRAWKRGFFELMTGKGISFYTFFTIIFVECIYLWTYSNIFIAFPATIFLLGYISNVILFAWFKGYYEGETEDLIMSILYVITYMLLYEMLIILGKLFYFDGGFKITIIPFIVTGISITLRCLQKTFYKNIIICTCLQIIIIGGPIISLFIMNSKAKMFLTLNIIISIIYMFIIPFIANLEAETANCNIFEMAFNLRRNKK